MAFDANLVAGIISAFLSLGAVATLVAKYAGPAIADLGKLSKKIGALEQLVADVQPDLQDADKVVSDLSSLISSAQGGSVSAASLTQIQADVQATVAAFKKTVSDAQAVVTA